MYHNKDKRPTKPIKHLHSFHNTRSQLFYILTIFWTLFSQHYFPLKLYLIFLSNHLPHYTPRNSTGTDSENIFPLSLSLSLSRQTDRQKYFFFSQHLYMENGTLQRPWDSCMHSTLKPPPEIFARNTSPLLTLKSA